MFFNEKDLYLPLRFYLLKNIIMKKIRTMTIGTVRGAYEAPKCEIIELQQESALCGSATHESYEEDYFDWSASSSVWKV